MNKIRVGIIFGGKSAEHEVSLQSAKNIYDALDKSRFEPVLIGISKRGEWRVADGASFLLNAGDPKLIKLNQSGAAVAPVPQHGGQLVSVGSPASVSAIDVAFPILHGPFGEDGTVQGLLKLANVPFVGAGVLGSAVGIDKDVMKRLLRDAGIPSAKFIALHKGEPVPSHKSLSEQLGKTMFVKPANLGSSVGVSKVTNAAELQPAIDLGFQFDTKILVEEGIDGRELECGVLGNENPKASAVGEIVPTHGFYSYEAKYIDPDGARLNIPAKIDGATAERVRALASQTFRVLGCEGLARVDCFLKKNGDVLVNEINTLPGFTKISMYPKLWEASGISYSDLINKLIDLAIARFERDAKLKTSY